MYPFSNKITVWGFCQLPLPQSVVGYSFVVHHKVNRSYIERTDWHGITKFYMDIRKDLAYYSLTTEGPLEPHFRGQGAKMSNRLQRGNEALESQLPKL